MALKLANNAVSRLSASITNTQTTIALQSGTGLRFPVMGVGDWFPLTLVRSDATYEIVRVTGRTGDTLTVVRGQEGTTAISFSANDRAELRVTNAVLTYFWSPDNDGPGSGLDADKLDGLEQTQDATPDTIMRRNASGGFAAAIALLTGITLNGSMTHAGDKTQTGNHTFDATAGERRLKWAFTGREAYFYGRDSDDEIGLYDTVLAGTRWKSDTAGNFTVPGAVNCSNLTATGSGTIGDTDADAHLLRGQTTIRYDVSSNDSFPLILRNTAASSAGSAAIAFDPNGNGITRAAQIRGVTMGANQTALDFYTANAATPVRKLRIDETGNFERVIPGGATLYPDYACRGWVNFNGTNGTVRAGGNIAITRTAVGRYDATITSMPDPNYSVSSCVGLNDTPDANQLYAANWHSPTSTSFKVFTGDTSANSYNDLVYVGLSLHR